MLRRVGVVRVRFLRRGLRRLGAAFSGRFRLGLGFRFRSVRLGRSLRCLGAVCRRSFRRFFRSLGRGLRLGGRLRLRCGGALGLCSVLGTVSARNNQQL